VPIVLSDSILGNRSAVISSFVFEEMLRRPDPAENDARSNKVWQLSFIMCGEIERNVPAIARLVLLGGVAHQR